MRLKPFSNQLIHGMLTSACMMTVLFLTSCNDKNDEFDDKGTASVVSLVAPPKAFMGDSILFHYQVNSSGAKPNQSKLQLYLGNELASERIMLTPHAGSYSGKLLIPFRKNMADQDVTIKLRTQNELFANAVTETQMQIERPKFAQLTFVSEDGKTYPMTPTADNPFNYTTGNQNFGGTVKGIIHAEAYGENGNPITFGNADGKILNGVNDQIVFTTGEEAPAPYPITFNIYSFVGSPFVKFAVNVGTQEYEFEKVDDNNYKVDVTMKKGDDLFFTGLSKAEYPEYWINRAYFDIVKGYDGVGGEGSVLRWRAKDGKYRIICDKGLKYFRVYPLNAAGTDLADRRNGDDIFYIIGNGGIGFPSYAKNKSNWGPSERKAMAVAPITDKVYEVVWQAGVTINPNDVNWKLFYQNGWGTETGNSDYATAVSEGIAAFDLNAQSDNGNIGKGSYNMKDGYYYRVTLDMTDGKIKWTCEEFEQLPEVDAK